MKEQSFYFQILKTKLKIFVFIKSYEKGIKTFYFWIRNADVDKIMRTWFLMVSWCTTNESNLFGKKWPHRPTTNPKELGLNRVKYNWDVNNIDHEGFEKGYIY